MEKERNVKASDWWSFLGINREDDSAWRRAARLSCYLLLWAASRNFPLCHHAENYEKADQGSELKGSNLHNQNIMCALPGTGHRHRCRCRSPLSCAAMWSPPLETGGCGRIPAVRWDCAAPQTWPAGQGSVLMAELQSRYEAEVLWSRTSACYSVMLGLPGGMESKMLS